MLSDVAFHLAATGAAITVVASAADYQGRRVDLPLRTRERGVAIVRVRTTRFGRGTTVGRLIDYLSFYLGASIACFRAMRRDDVLIAKTDPPLLSIPLGLVARLRRARFVAWQQDVYPEVAAASGMKLFASPVAAPLRWLRDRSLQRADCVIAIGPAMADRLAALGIAPGRIAVIPNFADDRAIRPIASAENALRRAWGFGADDLVVAYSGNLGRAHDLETVLGAARRLAELGEDRVRFLFVGGGFLHAQLAEAMRDPVLRRIVTQPYQARNILDQSLGVADVHWFSLRPEFTGLIVPSKLYGAAASGRALLFVGDPASDLGTMIASEGFGRAFAIGDDEGIVAWLQALVVDRAEVERSGIAARRWIDACASKAAAMARWESLLATLAAPASSAKRGRADG